MTVTDIVTQLQTNLEALDNGLPYLDVEIQSGNTLTTEEIILQNQSNPLPIHYLDKVWIGMPEKIPQGTQQTAVIEVVSNPSFYYTTCSVPEKDTDIYITLFCKGTTETANLAVYDLAEIVLTSLYADPKISDTCIGSTVEEVIYGDMAGTTKKNLIAACRITLRCRN